MTIRSIPAIRRPWKPHSAPGISSIFVREDWHDIIQKVSSIRILFYLRKKGLKKSLWNWTRSKFVVLNKTHYWKFFKNNKEILIFVIQMIFYKNLIEEFLKTVQNISYDLLLSSYYDAWKFIRRKTLKYTFT